MIWFFCATFVIGLATAAALVGWQRQAIINGRIHVVDQEIDVTTAAERKLLHFYAVSVAFLVALLHRLGLLLLIGVHRLLIWSRELLGKAERRFSRLSNAVRGRHVLSKKGSVSLFVLRLGAGRPRPSERDRQPFQV